jgi:hypothetical protein
MAITRRELLGGIAGLAQVRGQASGVRRTNVVFCLTDDHGAWAAGPWGCQEMYTPHLAKLASGGARFDEAYACTPVCSPSRMTYITGRLPSTHGVQDALPRQDIQGPERKRFLDGQPTYTELLARNGYTVGLTGKWHMGDDENAHAGFSSWTTVPGGGGPYKDPEFIRNGKRVKREGYKTDLVTDYAIDFIDASTCLSSRRTHRSTTSPTRTGSPILTAPSPVFRKVPGIHSGVGGSRGTTEIARPRSVTPRWSPEWTTTLAALSRGSRS